MLSARDRLLANKEREFQGQKCYEKAREMILHLWNSPDQRAQRVLAVGKSAPKCIPIVARQMVTKIFDPTQDEWRDYNAGIRRAEDLDKAYRKSKRCATESVSP